MNRVIRASETNVDMIVAETNLTLLSVQSNIACHLADFEEYPIVFLSGSKGEGNLVVTYKHTSDFERYYPGINVADTEFVNVARLSR